jgi:uncharacterized protein
MQYYPDRGTPGTPAANGAPEMKAVTVTTEDGLPLLAWFAPPRTKDGKVAKDGRIIVLYHGNAGHIGGRASKVRVFLDRGYGVFLSEYRGYGGNPGSPTEQGLYADARAGLKWLEAQGFSPAQFVIYGESIGSGPAVQMALEWQPKILILESPFTSAVEVAKNAYFWLPVDVLLKDRYENIAKIRDIHASLLIVHGDMDTVIPHALGQKLYDAANHPKQIIIIENGAHNDLYEHHAGHIIADWLKGQG